MTFSADDYRRYGMISAVLDQVDLAALSGVDLAAVLAELRPIAEESELPQMQALAERIRAVEASALDEAVDDNPSPKELLVFLEAAIAAGRPDSELFALRLQIRRAGEPNSPEWHQATEMLREAKRQERESGTGPSDGDTP